MAKQKIDEAEELKSRYEGELKSAIGDASIAMLPGYSISWKSTRPSKKFDLERFILENPQLAEGYFKPVPGHRVFRVTPSKELTP